MTTPYSGIICRQHGAVPLTKAEYDRQMAIPHEPWRCPKCGSASEFDDIEHERLHPEEIASLDDEQAAF